MTQTTIRPEQPGDEPAIHCVHAAAFETDAEAKLVDELRRARAHVVSMVAQVAEQIVGHVLFTKVTVTSDAGDWAALGLAPVAVLPEFQRQGIGTQLCRAALETCRAQGHGVAIVLGHAEYYPRFGFEPAVKRGIRWEHDVPDDAFMVLQLQPGALAGKIGVVRFHQAFAAV